MDRFRRQERAGESIQNAQSGQETGGSTVGLGDKELTVSKLRDIMKRQERCKGILGIWFSPLWSAGSKANENHLIQKRGQFLHRGPGQ